MGISFMNNVGVINTIRNISTIQRSLLKTGSKLSSGLRINTAADDPAGLVISERMRAQIGSIAQELANLDNNINMSNTADQAITGLEDKLIELRELALGAANSAAGDAGTLRAYQDASDNLVSSFNMARDSSSFGNRKLLDGSEGSVADIEKLDQIDLSSPEKAVEAVEYIDEAIKKVTDTHVQVGANTKNYMASFRSNLEVSQNNLMAAESAIRDTDYALEQTNFIKLLLRQKTAMGVLAQGNLQATSVFGLLSL
jgi:flagellin